MEDDKQNGSSNDKISKCQNIKETPSSSSEDGGKPSNSETNDPIRIPAAPDSGYFFPHVPASPPNFVSLDDIIKAADGVSNMALVHEIAVDKDFKLDKIEQPTSRLEQQVKETVYKAFWDILQSQLNEDPPRYDNAMVLLQEVKENLLSLLLPHHSNLKNQISEILDIELIRQQAENGALDFLHYSNFILSILAKLCAPVRDQQIKDLMKVTDIIPLFKGILDTISLMKLDLANFTIQQFRPYIQHHSIEYERKKFQEFLDTQSRISPDIDGLQFTRAWLKRTFESIFKERGTSSGTFSNVLMKSFLELLEWDKNNTYPETLLVDQARFDSASNKVNLLTLIASVLLVTSGVVGEIMHSNTDFKKALKNHITILLQGAISFSETELEQKFENVAVQVIHEVNNHLTKSSLDSLSDTNKNLLHGQIKGLSSPEQSVRLLIKNRVMQFIEQASYSSPTAPIKIPPGLSILETELTDIAGQFIHLMAYNRAVFGEYYSDIINKLRQEVDD